MFRTPPSQPDPVRTRRSEWGGADIIKQPLTEEIRTALHQFQITHSLSVSFTHHGM